MAGGLIQLVTRGPQDIYFTDDPQITFFKTVYRRHTNFSTEIIPQKFTHKPDFGKRIVATLAKTGDLIGKMYLVIVLPSIPIFKDSDGNIDNLSKFAWVRKVGYALIRCIEIEIGDELIDRHYGDWLNIWYELTVKRKQNIDKMLGNVKELTEFSNGKKSYKLMVPLQFWFNRFPGLALPVVNLKNSHIKINVELNDLDNCSIISPTNYINIENDFVCFEPFEYIKQKDGALGRFVHFDIVTKRLYYLKLSTESFKGPNKKDCKLTNSTIKGITSRFKAIPEKGCMEKIHRKPVNLKKISLQKVFLLVEYIYLDTEERNKFLNTNHEYLIEQLQFSGDKTIDGPNFSADPGFSNPCKELFWVAQLNSNINNQFNYTDSLIENEGKNIIKEETILLNSQERVEFRDSQYFNYIQPYQLHSNAPSEGINVYSFALHPEDNQISGSANLTLIENVLLKLIVSKKINFKNSANLKIYALSYNVLRVAHGISGLIFNYKQ